MYTPACIWWSKDTCGSWSPYHPGSRDWTLVIKHCSKHLYPKKATSPAQHQHCWRHSSNFLFPWKGFYEILIWYFQIIIFRLHFLPEYYREDASFLSALSPLEDTWPPSVTGDTDFDQGHFSQSTIWLLYYTVTTSALDRWRDLKAMCTYSPSSKHPP